MSIPMGELYPEFIIVSEQIIGQNLWEKGPLKETHTSPGTGPSSQMYTSTIPLLS